MRKSWVIAGLALLFTGSYLDSIRGPLLPVLTRALGIGYGAASWFLAAGSFAAVVCTYLLLPLSLRYSARGLSLGACGIGAASGALAYLVTNYVSLVALAAWLGTAVSTMGAMSNVLVISGTDEKSRARYLCGLHMMYALGSLIAPGIVAFLIDRAFSWQTVLLVGSPPILLLIAYIAGQVKGDEPKAAAVVDKSAGRLTVQIAILFSFATYVAGEVMLSAWMPTYLVEHVKMSVAESAPYLTGFFVMMALTRGLCFLSLSARAEGITLWSSLCAGVFFFAAGRAGWVWGFALAGLVGPFFPLLLARVSRRFPNESRTMTLKIITVMQVTFASCHFAVGFVTDRFGIYWAYWIPELGLVLALLALALYGLAERNALRGFKVARPSVS